MTYAFEDDRQRAVDDLQGVIVCPQPKGPRFSGRSIPVSNEQLMAEIRALRDEVRSLRATPAKYEYLTAKQAAKEFGVSTQMLYKLKRLHTKVGRLVRFRRADLENYLRRDRLAG